MNIEIGDKKYTLDKNDVVIARNSVNSFLDVVRRSSIKTQNDALYLTVLIMMYKKSAELLNEFGEENLKYVLDVRTQMTGKTADDVGGR